MKEMLMAPIIGIICGSLRVREWSPLYIGHQQSYIDAIVSADGAPMLIPLVRTTPTLRVLYERVDGLLFAGGGDVDPQRYGEAPIPELGAVDPLRDEVELTLARWAVAEGKPILGICRGVQLLNVAMGGSLYQDIPVQVSTEYAHNGSYQQEDWTHMAHGMRLDPSSQLSELFGTDQIPVNSLHHQALKDIASGLRPVGWAPDGVVEAVEGMREQFLIGVQCHPEALQAQADPRWQALFRRFVDRCRV